MYPMFKQIVRSAIIVALISVLMVSCGGKDPASPDETPKAPSNLTAEAVSATIVRLSWSDKSDNEDGFRIEEKAEGDSEYSAIDSVDADVTTYEMNDKFASTEYSYRIVSYNEEGVSEPSNVATVTTPDVPAGTPTNLTAEVLGKTEVHLRWELDNEPGDQVEIFRQAADDTSWNSIFRDDGAIKEYHETTLLPGVTYRWKIRNDRLGVFSDFSNEVSATTDPLDTPTDLTAMLQGNSSVLLNWQYVPINIEDMVIERKSSDDTSWTAIAQIPALMPDYTDQGLAGETTYNYRIYATLMGGRSDYSNIVTVETGGISGSLDLKAWLSDDNQIELSWNDVSDNEDGYEIARREPGGDWQTFEQADADVTSYTDLTVLPGNSYEYRVVAVGGDNIGDWSSVAAQTVPLWHKSYGQDEDELHCKITQVFGSYALAGAVESGGATTAGQAMLLDAEGGQQWSQQLTESGYEAYYDLAATLEGTFVAAGKASLNGGSSYVGVLVNYAANGDDIWQQQFTPGANVSAELKSVITTQDGTILAGGQTATTDEFWVLKADNSGNRMWDALIEMESGSDNFVGVLQIMVGQALLLTGSSGNGYTLRQIADGGDVIASFSLSEISSTSITGVSAGTGNELVVYGSKGNDGYVASVNGEGNVTWQRTITSSGQGAIAAVASDESGYYCIGTIETETTRGSDFWIVKLNNQGEIVFQSNCGGDEDDNGQGVTISGSNFAASGVSSSFSGSDVDWWILELPK